MQKQKLKALPPREILKALEDAFNIIPIVPRECVKAINKLLYNMEREEFTPEAYKSIMFLILRAFTAKDNYLKCIVYVLLEKLSLKCGDGILSLNSILKDINDKNMPVTMKNSALRILFTNMPNTMRFDFENFIKTALLDGKARDNAVCIASEYFKDMKIDTKIFDRIDDYHLSFFNRLPVKRYTSMLEIRRMSKNSVEVHKLGQYLNASTDDIIFFEAARVLTVIKQELAAPFVDKAISVLRYYLEKTENNIARFSSMKILNKLSIAFPSKVAKANREIEDLIQDSSKTISMMAILTLLKTGTEETARQLSSKLQPLMNTMSESYKVMTIETIEKLAKGGSRQEYIGLLKSSLFDRGRGSLVFKRFIMSKLDPLLSIDECQGEIVKFLCAYMEDPEYYQISMDILGRLSQYIANTKDFIHIYNRLILDNSHVRNCSYQTLFDMSGKIGTIDLLKSLNDLETEKLRSFLISNKNVKKGTFDINELGDLKEEVLKYLSAPVEEDVVEEIDDKFIKECRSVALTEKDADFNISVVKKVFKDSFILSFSFESNMSKVIVGQCLLTVDTGLEKVFIEIAHGEFKDTSTIIKEVEIRAECVNVINSVFEYQICLEDDIEETEKDSISLIPFDINVLDLVKPLEVLEKPENMKELTLKFNLRSAEAISKIVGVCNMFLIAEKDGFELHGYYNDLPILITGDVTCSKYSSVNMKVMCDDEDLLDKIVTIFD
ncbi:coatomer subunit gamma [Glugoides intestinalis]